MRRFMITAYNGNAFIIGDVHAENPVEAVEDLPEGLDVTSIIEVQAGMDYDKLTYEHTVVDGKPFMCFKHA